MTLLLITLSGLTSVLARIVNTLSRHIYLIASILIVIPTLYD